MRVLVTGGAGFVGSHLCDLLRARGDQVRVLDCLDDAYDPGLKLQNLCPDDEFHCGDIRDPEAVRRALAGVDAVAHLAARAGVRDSLRDPGLYASVNVEGTTTLLRGAREAGVRRVVVASSSSVYGARAGSIFRESDPIQRPQSPYAASKAAMEAFCYAMSLPGPGRDAKTDTGMDISVARLFTVYGPRQRPNMAIQKFCQAILRDKEIEVYGDGSSLRDYTWVGDAARGLAAALDRAAGFRVVNIAGGQPIRLDALIALCGRAIGRSPRLRHLPDQPGDVPETQADLSVARAWLGYAPEVGMEDGIRRFVGTIRG